MEWKVSKKLIDYEYSIRFMENKIDLIHKNEENELIWFLEHDHIYTAGTSSNINELLIKPDIKIYKTGRGGKYTYHGPGQQIIYVMIDLRKRDFDIKKFIFDLEEWLIISLAEIGIKSERRDNRVGIWFIHNNCEEKIVAIGIRVRKWISYHGIAINVYPNLDYYNNIIACGIREYGVSSIKKLGFNVSMERIRQVLINNFTKIF